ncbi:MAG: ketoacyl-ACP synthase III [Pseudomonadota bacterium]|nr:ketoacyl-ACP synthase III [Pseudomonadota bacterium]
MTYSRIIGTGGCLPDRVITNEELSKTVDTNDEWIMQRVGIKERHVVSNDETTCSISKIAAERAIEAAGISPNDIDMVIMGTATPDFNFPSSACVLQDMLKITNECPAFDINAACAGFIYGLSMADQYIKTGACKTVLIVGVDSLSKVTDWTDRGTCVLFGDGAGAVILQASAEPGIHATHLHADGQFGDLLFSESTLWKKDATSFINMKGSDVYRIAVKKLGEIVDNIIAKSGIQKSDIDWLIPHQANMRIIQALAKRLDMSMDKVILTIEQQGNTSAASIPLALDYGVRNGKIQRGDLLLMDAFGAGLAWGGALVTY